MQRKHSIKWILCLLFMVTTWTLTAQDYPTNSQITQRLKRISSNYSTNTKLTSLVKTTGGKDIWGLTVYSGNHSEKPGIAIVGGVEGDHLLGVELVLNFVEDLLANQKDLLNKTTFYVFPNMSPDAYEQYFADIKYGRKGNASITDDDRDGELNEDPFEDLNGDGVITWMRVEDATGKYITHPADDRIMRMADPKKGEKGKYKIYTEGRDNDQDGQWNEDGEGGISFNKNMSFNFPYFQAGAGEHPVSEKENRALLDFLYEQWNLYAILTLGPQNNLSAALKYNKQGASKRVVTSILKQDESLNQLIADKYNEVTGAKDGKLNKGKGGDFFEWAYFHFGKLSLSTPGWWVPKMKVAKGDSITVPNKDNNQEVNFVRWAAKQELNNYFIDWASFDHPDFKGKKVEIGGVVPFKMINPPFGMVDSIATKNNQFIYSLVGMQQSIKLLNVETESLGNNLTRVTLDLYNEGTLPTHTEMGQKSRWLRRIKAEVKLTGNQTLVSGKKITLINNINGDDAVQMTWLIKGKGKVTIQAGAPHAGTDQTTITLK